MRRRGGSAVPLDYLLVDTAAVPVASALKKTAMYKKITNKFF
jgi:hypothetical protein